MRRRDRILRWAVVLLLLASVGTASAGCAWVLWEHFERIDVGYAKTGPLPKDLKEPVALEDKWVIETVVDSRAICEAALERSRNYYASRGWEPAWTHSVQPLYK
jgi:hypothetical protein